MEIVVLGKWWTSTWVAEESVGLVDWFMRVLDRQPVTGAPPLLLGRRGRRRPGVSRDGRRTLWLGPAMQVRGRWCQSIFIVCQVRYLIRLS